MILLLSLLACTSAPESATTPRAPVEQPVLTIYSGRSESLVGPLFARIEAETGVKVAVQYGDTPEMVTRMLSEAAETPADLIFAQDSGHLGALAARGALTELPAGLLDQVEPPYRDPEGRWLGTSGRLRSLVVSTSLTADALPQRLQDLADPQWRGKLGWAPGNGSFQAHVSALRSLWGEDATRTWLEGVSANEPVRYPKNSPQVAAVGAGAIQIGWVNHYYWHRSKPEGAANYSFPIAGDAGNLLMLSGIGVSAHSPHQRSAEKVVDWLVSEEVQAWFATENFEYPTRPGVPLHGEVQPLQPGALAEVEQAALADLAPTRALLQSLGLI